MKFENLFQRFTVFLAATVLTTQLLLVFIFFFLPDKILLPALLAGLVTGTLISIFVARLLSFYVVKHLQALRVLLRAIENGEKIDPIDINTQDELADITKHVNELLNRDKAVEEANQDALTGLSNRRHLMQKLEKWTSAKTPITLMFIDLDGFKPINDKHGHEAGDEALRVVADRLLACTRERDLVCRLGGDEFVIVFVNMDERKTIEERADKVLEMLNTPFWIGGQRLKMGGSIGIALAPQDAQNADALLVAADESMYAAKQGGKNAYRFYS